jgi:hypothetical protein
LDTIRKPDDCRFPKPSVILFRFVIFSSDDHVILTHALTVYCVTNEENNEQVAEEGIWKESY